jgi:diphthine-ammonia ligase
MTNPAYALMTSGGKDSTLALDAALSAGYDVTTLINLYDPDSDRIRFHGVRRELIVLQASSLGIDLMQHAAAPDTFEEVFLRTLRELRSRATHGIIFGNIHLADVRAWYEERTQAHGLDHIEPLWGMAPAAVVDRLLARGYRARITSVDVTRAPRAWLGRIIDDELGRAMTSQPGVDAAGERGEYHTLVEDGPLFRVPLHTTLGAVFETPTHALIDVVPTAQ